MKKKSGSTAKVDRVGEPRQGNGHCRLQRDVKELMAELVACRKEIVSADAASWIGIFPLDRLCVRGISVDIAPQLAGKILYRGEHSACNHVSFNLGKPDLNLIQPRGIGRCEMKMHVRMSRQKVPHDWALVRG